MNELKDTIAEIRVIINAMDQRLEDLKSMRFRLEDIETRLEQTKTL